MFSWLRTAPKQAVKTSSGAVTVGEVFVPAGKPGITYVPRIRLGLENILRDHIRETREILLLIGPTKSGKSVLTQTVIPAERRVTVDGTRVRDREDRFWNDVAAKVGAATPGGEGGRGFPPDPQEDAINLLIASEKVLVIEDFHTIAPEVQRNIIRSLKGPVFEGLRVIVLGIPHRENDVVAGMIDMQDRTRTLHMPSWSRDDLREICTRGFKALNVEPAANVITQFCAHAFGSPNLLQKFCLRLCLNHGITERQPTTVKISLGTRYETFFEEFVAQESNRDVTRIVADFRSPNESRLKHFKLNEGGDANIYQLVLLAISRLLPATMIPTGDIGRKIEELVKGDPPETEAISAAVRRLGVLAQEISDELKVGQPVLEYDPKLRKLHITDASFAFHVKWGRL
jgi:hypothetical protein